MGSRLIGRFLSLYVYIVACSALSQSDVDYLAENLDIKYAVNDNIKDVHFTFTIYITNSGNKYVSGRDWALYFCHIRMIEPDTMMIDDGTSVNPDGVIIGKPNYGLRLFHVNGCLFKIVPTKDFWGWSPGLMMTIPLEGANWQVARTDAMPNWYISGMGSTKAKTIKSTAGESLDYVADFTTKAQWKRSAGDKYDPYTPEQRYDMFSLKHGNKVQRKIVPRPSLTNLSPVETVYLNKDDWVIVADDAKTLKESVHLKKRLGIQTTDGNAYTNKKIIRLQIDKDLKLDSVAHMANPDSYSLGISQKAINIKGRTPSGLFYGIQTLLSMTSFNMEVPLGTVEDTPRFAYRGMHADVGRNFQSKESILNLLDAMAHYKLNKFHFHVTDDEAWRLEIPGIPELVEVGSRQCHDPTGDSCIMPQLGGDTEKGQTDHKYYSVAEYKEILQHAEDLHIEVIPEFDLPGHCHAAINAILARYRKYKDTDKDKATEYLLIDLEDKSKYFSVQMFTDNAVNPCVNSSYTFVKRVLDEVVDMHKDIQPLKIFNFGGDEVPATAWLKSPACTALGMTERKQIKTHFVKRVAELVAEKKMDLAAWEDGVMSDGATNLPYDKEEFDTDTIYAYPWNNIWEWGSGSRAYKLANAGYKTVIAHATHFYYDHPSEPDPEERGYYWATRIVFSEKSFGYMPDSVYDNIHIDGLGNIITKEKICKQFECPALKEKDNIIGIQGELWSETVRTQSQFGSMVFPRMLSMAERAWHKAAWESETDVTKRDAARRADWEAFAKLVGSKELTTLEGFGLDYQVRPPGAKLSGRTLFVNSEFPGQPLQYSIDGGSTWINIVGGQVQLDDTVNRVHVVARSNNGKRMSRVVDIDVP